MLDLARRALGMPRNGRVSADTFASVLERGLGSTICREFYFPYARKIWGLEPEEISPIQAQRRVSAGSIGKLVKRLVAGGGKGGGRSRKGIFYYPRRGYGQISERLCDAARAAGGRVELCTSVRRIERVGDGFRIEAIAGSETRIFESRYVWSTIPVTVLVRMWAAGAPASVLAAASKLELRAMLLVYLVLGTDQFSEYDAHYFPEIHLPFTRVSEPKNYAALPHPAGRTVLCAEVPCSRGDALWSKTDAELAGIVADGLARASLPVNGPILDVAVRRLPAAYPIYRVGYEEHFTQVDQWVSGLEGVLSFGRQGLYAHDNTHHALHMALAAVECLGDGAFDAHCWRQYRQVFESHVVED
jgi:protoporphyrinogen oxidase